MKALKRTTKSAHMTALLTVIYALAGSGIWANAQTISSTKSSDDTTQQASVSTDTKTTSAAPLTDREKELLERVERLEKRLSDLERVAFGRSTTSADTAVATNKTQVPAAVAGTPAETVSGTEVAKATSGKDDNKFLERGILPGSILIPGTDLSLKVGGYLKADFIQDFQGIGNRSQFATNTIPVGGTPNADLGGGTNIQARETRLTLEIVGPEDKRKYRLYVEGDFYGDGNAFRLRQAYGEYGNFLAGQTWTTFMDLGSRPRTLDYEGPDGEIFVRQAMVRWTQNISKNWRFAVAAEEPTVQIATPAGFTGSARGYMPDFTGFLRYHNKRAQLHLGGVVRSLRFDGTGSTPDDSTIGWGINSAFKLGAFGKDHVMGQFAFGSGMSRYIASMSGQNVDALFGAGGELVSVPARSAVLGYERHWTPKLMSAFAYAISDISYNTGFSGSVIKRTQDGRVNLIWTPFRLVDLGVEYIFGRRDNQNGSHGAANRLQFSTIYRFN